MPLFDTTAEKERKANLRALEDKRLAFAQDLAKKGFAPDRMLLCSSEQGNFAAIARANGKYAVIVSPTFGQDGDFTLDMMDEIHFEREDVFEKGSGLNGAFVLGTKGAKGFNLHITLASGGIATLQVVAGRTSYLEIKSAAKNPLLKTKRRRGDANVVWDMVPIDPSHLPKIETALNEHYLA